MNETQIYTLSPTLEMCIVFTPILLLLICLILWIGFEYLGDCIKWKSKI